jgi:hypothetical protein
MRRIIFTRMRLTGVKKNELHTFGPELSRHRFQRRRRQRTVGSGKGTELDQHVAFFQNSLSFTGSQDSSSIASKSGAEEPTGNTVRKS